MRQEVFTRVWDETLGRAVAAGASDVHFEPIWEELRAFFRVRFRVAGVLREEGEHPAAFGELLIDRLKILSGLDVAERRVPQDGRLERPDVGADFRVSTVPCAGGEKAVLRILRKDNRPQLANLGFSREARRTLVRALEHSSGLIVVAGATGSGKTTTLHALISELDSTKLNISTLEDPVEYRFPGLTQIPVTRSLSFAAGLRALLRQDPDVILVGEVRDPETAKLAIEAAGTGHLVLTSLHANSADDTVTRLIELGCDREHLARNMRLAAFQKLVARDGKMAPVLSFRT